MILVLVSFGHGRENKYLFESDFFYKRGTKVLCDTKNGETVGYVSSALSFGDEKDLDYHINKGDAISMAIKATGATLPLKKIIGEVKEVPRIETIKSVDDLREAYIDFGKRCDSRIIIHASEFMDFLLRNVDVAIPRIKRDYVTERSFYEEN